VHVAQWLVNEQRDGAVRSSLERVGQKHLLIALVLQLAPEQLESTRSTANPDVEGPTSHRRSTGVASSALGVDRGARRRDIDVVTNVVVAGDKAHRRPQHGVLVARRGEVGLVVRAVE